MPRGGIALIALLAVVAFPDAATGAARKAPKTRSVLYVGNNWDGTADVIQAINLRTKGIIWRTKVDGNRADHMAISPDGKRLLVSASTAKVIDVIDTKTGAIVAKVPSGDQPHENNFSKDGKLVYHASIGTVFTPSDDPALDFTKGERVFEIIDTSNWQVVRKIDMGKKLDEYGEPDMSGAVRPMALSPDERYLYFQVSFFHGFVEYDLQQDRVLRLAHLPESDEAKQKRRDEYLLDSAHHGLAMNPSGTKLCAAGTMSDYATIVDRGSFAYTIAAHGHKPYWATNSGRGSSGCGWARSARDCWARRSRAARTAHAEPRPASRYTRHIATRNTLADQSVSQRNA
jgi:hypothetical protein